MQHQMPVLPQILSLNPLKDSAKVEAVDYFSVFQNLYSRLDDFMNLYDRGKLPAYIIRYISGLTKTAYQGQIDSVETKRKCANDSYDNKNVIEFNILLKANHYINFQRMPICFPFKFKSADDNDNNLGAGAILVNNSFGHRIKEINIVRYGDDKPVLPLINNFDIYRYSDKILKHMPEKALKTFQNSLLYSSKKVILNTTNRDKTLNNT